MEKMNVDATTSKDSIKCMIAVVVRGGDVDFLGALTVVTAGITDPEMLEAMATREGLALAADLILQRFRVATECINVVWSLKGKGK
jgi:hypothetical protein